MHCPKPSLLAALAALCAAPAASAQNSTITVGTTNLGPTPEVIGYNLGHWSPGSNVGDWWRYSGVRHARIFLPKRAAEWKDDNSSASSLNYGDGVTTLAGFTARRDAMIAAGKSSSYANWSGFLARLTSALPWDSQNQLTPDSLFADLRAQGVDPLVQLTASWSNNQPAAWGTETQSNLINSFPTTSADDWGGYWEIWQHYYVVAYLLAERHGVTRWSLFNEPNHEGANGITPEEWRRRIRVASDAVQAAIAKVGSFEGRPLVPRIYAPTTTAALGTIYPTWGQPALAEIDVRYTGLSQPGWKNFHVYSYQPYGMNYDQYGLQVSTMRSNLASMVGVSPRMPIANTEFGVLNNGEMQDTDSTLDSPDLFVGLARILHKLQAVDPAYGVDQMYLYKFGQTKASDPNDYPVNKLGTHYVQNAVNSGFNYGGITRGGEIYRLFNRAAAWRSDAQPVQRRSVSTTLAGVDVFATYDPVEQTHHVFSINRGATDAAVSYDVSALGLQTENRVTIQEVSTTCHGGVRVLTRVNGGRITPPGALQPPQSVWLASIPARAQSFRWPEGHPLRSFNATHDATLRDGMHASANYSGESTLRVRNDSATPEGRELAVVRFDVPASELANLSQAVLALNVAASAAGASAQAHVYGFVADANMPFTEAGATWSAQTAWLKQNAGAGSRIEHNVVKDQAAIGATPPIRILGQIVADSTAYDEKRVDVTDFVRANAGQPLCFVVVQDKRWDTNPEGKTITQATAAINAGDTQAAGLDITSRESAVAPRLRVTRY